MNSIYKLGLSITAISIFVGCSAKGPQFNGFEKPIEGKSLIYIYRSGSLLGLGGGVQPKIHKTDLDTQKDVVIGSIEPAGYIKTEVDSSKNIEIWAKTEWKNEVQIITENQKIYCIQHYITPGILVGHPQFELQNLEKCEQEIKQTKLSIQENEK